MRESKYYMNIFNLLALSPAGQDYAQKLRKNIILGCCYPWLLKLDILLYEMGYEQQEIITKNFRSIKQAGQLVDKLAELLVAFKFFDQKPLFFDDNDGKPDIYLERLGKSIEVKRINISDHEKQVINHLLLNTEGVCIENSSNKLLCQDEMWNALIRKTKKQVKKATKQLKNNGIICLIYCLDSTGYIQSIDQRNIDFVKEINLHLNLLNKNSVTLEIIQDSQLFN